MSKDTTPVQPDEVIGPEGPPIERHCKECGAFIRHEPSRENGQWVLGPCENKVKGRKLCRSYNVYLSRERRTISKSEPELEEERVALQKQTALAPFDGDRPYNKELLMFEIVALEGLTVEARIESGKRLVVLRENEEHGNFLKALEGMNIPRSTAYRRMKLATRSVKFPTVGSLKRISAAYAISDLDDEDLHEMEKTGLLDGKPRDEIEEMTGAEARALVRKLKKENAKGEEQVKRLRKERDALKRGHDGELTELDHGTAQALKALAALSLIEIEDEEREAAENYFASITDALEAVRVNLLDTGAPA